MATVIVINNGNLNYLNNHLKNEHYATYITNNIRSIFNKKPDIILIDSTISSKKAFLIIKNIRNTQITRFVPIIVISPYYCKKEKIAYLASEVNDYIVNTTTYEILSARISSLLRIKLRIEELVFRVAIISDAYKLEKNFNQFSNKNVLIIPTKEHQSKIKKYLADIPVKLNYSNIFSTKNYAIAIINIENKEDLNLCIKLRNKNQLKGTFLLGIFNNYNDEIFIKALKIGIDEYILKPINQLELVIKVQRYIKIYNYQKKLLSQHKTDLFIDTLTGVYNRKYIEYYFSKLIKKSSCTLSLIDIDNLKKINDIEGHIKGDYILKTIAKLLLKNFRRTDLIGRFGGDEFILIIHNIEENQLKKSLNIFQKNLSKSKNYILAQCTFTAGIEKITPSDTLLTVIDKADKKLRKAKKYNKNYIEEKL